MLEGMGFPKEVELSEIIDFNREAIDVITDESGQRYLSLEIWVSPTKLQRLLVVMKE